MNNESLGDIEALQAQIKDIASKIKTDSNPEQLDQLKVLIKKNVPFTLRGYFSAYLLREILNNKKPQQKSFKPKFENNKKENTFKQKEKAPVKNVSPDSAVKEEKEPLNERQGKTLYLNIGKIKHLYAKDLAKLLQSELGIEREDIFFIKIHDKYSFITMSEENCNKAIEVLNGKEINGRIAQINYSNRKPREEATTPSPDTNTEDQGTVQAE